MTAIHDLKPMIIVTLTLPEPRDMKHHIAIVLAQLFSAKQPHSVQASG